jgi:hypothetical protein
VTLTATPAPTVQALGSAGFYRIVQDRQVTTYSSFANFRSAVTTRAQSTPVFRVSAFGTFSSVGQVFSAATMTVVLDG